MVAHAEAVVICLINIHHAHEVRRRHQFLLKIPRQIAAVEKPERPERKQKHRTVCVVARVHRLRRDAARERISLLRLRRRRLHKFLIRGETPQLDFWCVRSRRLQRHAHPRRQRHALRRNFPPALDLHQEGRLRPPVRIPGRNRPLVNRPKRQHLRDLRAAAEMIPVEVRQQHVIDPGQPRRLRRRHDARRIPPARIARVDQHRLARRRDQQRRTAAFRIDPIHIKRLRFLVGPHARRGKSARRQRTGHQPG